MLAPSVRFVVLLRPGLACDVMPPSLICPLFRFVRPPLPSALRTNHPIASPCHFAESGLRVVFAERVHDGGAVLALRFTPDVLVSAGAADGCAARSICHRFLVDLFNDCAALARVFDHWRAMRLGDHCPLLPTRGLRVLQAAELHQRAHAEAAGPHGRA